MGQNPKTFVEINGKKYDAITGKPVANTPVNAQTRDDIKNVPDKPQPENPVKPTQTGGSLGGLIEPSGTPASQPAAAKATPAHSSQIHAGSRKGHALHRGAAKVDTPPSPAAAYDNKQDQQPQPTRRKLAQNVDAARLHRSSKHPKSSAIAKFSAGAPAAQTPAQPETLTVPGGEPNTTPVLSPKEELIAKQLAKTAANQIPPADKEPFKNRIANKLKRGRNSSVVAASLTSLLLIGYVTYLNIPRMALRVASGRAGFAAELPSYAPSGFRFNGPVAYSPGELTLQYTSNTDDRYYRVTEKETAWDSQTLLDNYVIQETELYSTYQQRGLTIYMFHGSTATWVNGGIWYTINGDSQLTSEQLLKIAASL